MLAKGSTKPIALSFLPTIFSFLFYLLGLEIFVYISIISLLFPVLIVIFFRDPDRKIGEGIVSPADGKVVVVDKENNSFDIFMNITNVHVNRAPEGGLIDKTKKFRGGYYPAFMKRSSQNYRHRIDIRTKYGKISVWQIAGIFARRIVPYIEEGDVVDKGERIGIIRFGSRVKVKLPQKVRIVVNVGEKVKAGETMVGDFYR